jgi:hypothetical protein
VFVDCVVDELLIESRKLLIPSQLEKSFPLGSVIDALGEF